VSDEILTDEERAALESMCEFDDQDLSTIAETLLQHLTEETN